MIIEVSPFHTYLDRKKLMLFDAMRLQCYPCFFSHPPHPIAVTKISAVPLHQSHHHMSNSESCARDIDYIADFEVFYKNSQYHNNVDRLYHIPAAFHNLYMPGKILAWESILQKNEHYLILWEDQFSSWSEPISVEFRPSRVASAIVMSAVYGIPVYKQNRLGLWRCGRNSWGECRRRARDRLDMQYAVRWPILSLQTLISTGLSQSEVDRNLSKTNWTIYAHQMNEWRTVHYQLTQSFSFLDTCVNRLIGCVRWMSRKR